MIDMPVLVQHEDFIQNGVLVRGGTNWDVSATAQETPIQLAAPLPAATVVIQQKMDPGPFQRPVVRLEVSKKYQPLSKAEKKKLCSGLVEHEYVVASGKSAQATRLAKNVVNALKGCGKGFQASEGMIPFTTIEPNQVEIFFKL